MKNLIFKNDLFYLSDEVGKKNGKSKSESGYNADSISNKNMPHQYFNNKIVIYGRHTCPYCIGALASLKKKPLLYKKVIFVDIEAEPSNYFSKANLINILKSNESTFDKSHSTVPIVFDKGVFVGGADKSEEYFKDM